MNTSEDIKLISDSAERLSTGLDGIEKLRELFAESGTIWLSDKKWRLAAQAGWFGVASPDRVGGAELGGAGVIAIAYECGKRLVVTPIAENMAVAAGLSHLYLQETDVGSGLLDEILAGDVYCVPKALGVSGLAKRSGREANGHSGSWRDRLLIVNLNLQVATKALFYREMKGESQVRIVRIDKDRVWEGELQCVDGTRAMAFSHDQIDRLLGEADFAVEGKDAELLIKILRSIQWIFYAAYLCGSAETSLEMVIEYVKIRKQFGRAIGSNQAVQHRLAQQFANLEGMKAVVEEAAKSFGRDDSDVAAAMALDVISSGTLELLKEVIQLHGAIGFTNEYRAGFYMKRCMTLGAYWKDEIRNLLDGSIKLEI